MGDLIYIVVTLFVFVSGILFVDACERLRR